MLLCSGHANEGFSVRQNIRICTNRSKMDSFCHHPTSHSHLHSHKWKHCYANSMFSIFVVAFAFVVRIHIMHKWNLTLRHIQLHCNLLWEYKQGHSHISVPLLYIQHYTTTKVCLKGDKFNSTQDIHVSSRRPCIPHRQSG